MIKTLLAINLFVLGSCLGQYFSKKYTKRYVFYKCLKQFNDDFINELGFCKSNLKIVLSKKYQSTELNSILKQQSEQLARNMKLGVGSMNILKTGERKELDEYFLSLGKSDSDTQLKILSIYQKNFEQKVSLMQGEQQKYGTLCKKTGIIVGLIAFVIAV